MTDPHTSIRKLLRLASHAGSSAESHLAQARAELVAKKYNVDLATLVEAPSQVEVPPRKYDWFNGDWVRRDKW